MDYVLGAAALAAPKLLGFSHYSIPTKISRSIGMYALTSALTTKSGGGILKALPWGAHMKMDAVGNAIAWGAPWLFGFASNERATRTILALAALQTIVWVLSKKK